MSIAVDRLPPHLVAAGVVAQLMQLDVEASQVAGGGELNPALGRLRVCTIDGINPHQGIELLLALTLARLAHLSGDRVSSA